MKITSAAFVSSNSDYRKCPPSNMPEFAFIGRSNVGKSSLINMLVSRKGLAKTSATPGKTQLINHFIINENWYLVDLPGYGYAKIARTEKQKWEKMTEEYLIHRTNLVTIFVLIDSRLEPQKSDTELINRLGTLQLPFSIVFTKCDKLTKNQLSKNISAYKKHLLNWWEELPPLFFTSAESGTGKDELLEFIEDLI